MEWLHLANSSLSSVSSPDRSNIAVAAATAVEAAVEAEVGLHFEAPLGLKCSLGRLFWLSYDRATMLVQTDN